MKDNIWTFLKYFMLAAASFIVLLPFISVLITAFKTVEEYGSTNVMVLPHTWFYFGNFVTAWQRVNMTRAFFNTVVVLIFVLSGSIMISAMLAFVLNRVKFPGNSVFRNLFLFAALIPGVAMQVTVYQIMYSLHLINSLGGYIILLMGSDVISIYIFLQFFASLPVSLDESAILDGCSLFGVFFKILLPLTQPAIITCMILKGVSTYNEYYMANLYLQDKTRLQVVSTSLYKFTGPMGNQYNYICAGVLITIIPALIVFILCQKRIYNGLAQGAVKG
jgi:multiple sugar transport system permease protein